MLFTPRMIGLTVLGVFLCIIICAISLWLAFWCKYRGGRQRCEECFRARERRRIIMQNLPDEIEYLKARIRALTEHTGLGSDNGDGCEEIKLTEEEEVETNW